MLSNPDNALPLYLLVVVMGIMLGKAWRPFLASLTTAGSAAQTTAGSAATSGGSHV